jgi:hypothetical protein
MTTVGAGGGAGCRGQLASVGVGGGRVPAQTQPNAVAEPLGREPDRATS